MGNKGDGERRRLGWEEMNGEGRNESRKVSLVNHYYHDCCLSLGNNTTKSLLSLNY